MWDTIAIGRALGRRARENLLDGAGGRGLAMASLLCVVSLLTVFMQSMSASAEDWAPLWSTTTLSESRQQPVGVTVGNKVILAGGWNAASQSSNAVDIFDFDLSAGTWSQSSGTLSRRMYNAAGASVGTKAYFGGGAPTSGVPVNTVNTYDTAGGTWSTDPAGLSEHRWDLAAASANGFLVFAGGFSTAGYSSVSNKADIYNASAGTWSQYSLPGTRGFMGAASAGTKIFFAGGSNGLGSDYGNVYICETTAGTCTWSTNNLSQWLSGNWYCCKA